MLRRANAVIQGLRTTQHRAYCAPCGDYNQANHRSTRPGRVRRASVWRHLRPDAPSFRAHALTFHGQSERHGDPPAPAGASLCWRRPCRQGMLRSPLARRRCRWPLPVAREWAALPARPARVPGKPCCARLLHLRCGPLGADAAQAVLFGSHLAAHPRFRGRPWWFWGGAGGE
jgi:hypothetical protein